MLHCWNLVLSCKQSAHLCTLWAGGQFILGHSWLCETRHFLVPVYLWGKYWGLSQGLLSIDVFLLTTPDIASCSVPCQPSIKQSRFRSTKVILFYISCFSIMNSKAFTLHSTHRYPKPCSVHVILNVCNMECWTSHLQRNTFWSLCKGLEWCTTICTHLLVDKRFNHMLGVPWH